MRKRIFAAVLAVIVLLSVTATPVAAAELSIEDVSLPSSVTQGDEFDLEVGISGSDVENVEATLSLPDGLSCTPTGTQDVTLTDGDGTATFSCTADAPGEYDSDISVTVTADRTSDGQTIDDQTQTGIDVLSPASLTLSTSVDDDSVEEGSSTGLTIVVHNTGDAATGYDISVSPGSGLSVDTSSASGSVDGGSIDSTEYTLTGEDSDGDQTVDITVTGDNGQTLNESETIEVMSSGGDGGDGGDGGSSGSNGDAVSATTPTDDRVLPADTIRNQETRDLVDADPDRAGVQVQFETGSVRELSFENDAVAGDGTVEVQEGDTVPADVSPPSGTVRTAIEITVPDDLRNEPATIRIGVDADRIETSPERVVIERYDAESDTWTELDTNPVETGGDVVELEAETPGFSLFAVTESDGDATVTQTTVQTTMPETSTPADDTTATPGSVRTSASTTETGTPGFGLAVAIIAVLGTALVAVRRR